VLPHDGRQHLGGWRVVLLALPACCDIAGTTLMNVGLLFVAASIYQMTRGALVLFVGLFSVLFLRRRLVLYKWAALFIVVGGVAVVGLAGALARDHKAVPKAVLQLLRADAEPDLAMRTIVGVLLIAAAQMFTATQFVLEESIMEKYSLEPLKAVGWEGLWGFVVTVICMIVLHLTVGKTEAGKYGYFDAAEGLREVWENKTIMISSVLIMISIG
jgi:drug/metabolite transporter (DMT)-like permease